MTDMATSLYDDSDLIKMNNDAVKRKKATMSLDFGNAKRAKGKLGLLASPDLNMLKLASPELEKFIIQHNGVVTTPTPTQILFPKTVTEEQEAYARGFMDALAELHKQDPTSANTEKKADPVSVLPRLATLQTVNVPALNQLSTGTIVPGFVAVDSRKPNSSDYDTVPATVAAHSPTPIAQNQYIDLQAVNSYTDYAEPKQMNFKEEPQTVPDGYTPPVSPIDMEEQEYIKTDRKRARNRVAARKCRFRKLERISNLETRVSELKGQNSQLSQDALTLKEQVAQLKQQIMEHVKSGCQIMVSSNFDSIL